MNELASSGQLRMSLLRWLLVCVPAMVAMGSFVDFVVNAGPANRWFAALIPPQALLSPTAFALIWALIYACAGAALALILSARGARRRPLALLMFLHTLVGMALWKLLFFAHHDVSTAVVMIGLLLGFTLVTAVLFARIRKSAGLLMLPLLGWLCFSAFLNIRIDAQYPDAETLVPPAASANIGGGQDREE
ncbi:MAG: TspO/MBR family protein [Sphingopyxis sp.]